MSTSPLVLLVEPNPLVRELLHGELKDQGCIVVDASSSEEALAFAQIYPGSIDLAVTDLPPAGDDGTFAATLRALPTGSRARVVRVEEACTRRTLLKAVRQVLPTGSRPRPRYGDRAVFWGAGRETATSAAVQ